VFREALGTGKENFIESVGDRKKLGTGKESLWVCGSVWGEREKAEKLKN
jgi:hypothetical protein